MANDQEIAHKDGVANDVLLTLALHHTHLAHILGCFHQFHYFLSKVETCEIVLNKGLI